MQIQENTKTCMYMYNFSIFVSKNFGLLRKSSALWVFCLLFHFILFFYLKTYSQFGSLLIHEDFPYFWASQVAPVVKNPLANAGDIRHASSAPGSGRSHDGMAMHSSILVWRIPWTEEPGGLQSTELQRVGHYWSDLACMFLTLT